MSYMRDLIVNYNLLKVKAASFYGCSLRAFGQFSFALSLVFRKAYGSRNKEDPGSPEKNVTAFYGKNHDRFLFPMVTEAPRHHDQSFTLRFAERCTGVNALSD